MKKSKKLLKLFFSMLYISTFTLGGGFVISTFMKKKFVDELGWIDEEEMLDLIALAQSSPGAIAVNCAILVGRSVCGILGIITAVVGTVIPPAAILTVVSFFYNTFAQNRYISRMLGGMQAGVVAVIADVVCDLGKGVLKEKSPLGIIIMAAAFVSVFFFKINVMAVVGCALLIGIINAAVKSKREARQK